MDKCFPGQQKQIIDIDESQTWIQEWQDNFTAQHKTAVMKNAEHDSDIN